MEAADGRPRLAVAREPAPSVCRGRGLASSCFALRGDASYRQHLCVFYSAGRSGIPATRRQNSMFSRLIYGKS